MLALLRAAEVFTPENIGKSELLIGGGEIIALERQIDLVSEKLVDEIDLSGKWLVPGFVDSLVHITGGGGEGGFGSRTPELQLSDAVRAGVTTLVGALGTDSLTRNLSNLIAKVRELNAAGLHCLCYTGSYHFPVKTLCGSVERDIVFIPEMIGVGEVAISDHRSSQPIASELAKLAAEARVAGMIAGKAGIVSVHVGDGDGCLDPLLEVGMSSDIPLGQFYPTHINRNPRLFDAGMHFARQGGAIDLTTSTTPDILASGEIKCSRALKLLIDRRVPLERVSFSSDGQASLPLFDAKGELSGLKVGNLASLWQEVRDAILDEQIEPSLALSVVTRNPARILKLQGRGQLQAGGPADLLVIDPDSMQIESVMAGGKWLMREGEVLVKGQFE